MAAVLVARVATIEVVADVDRGDHAGDVAVDLLELHQPREQLTQRGRPRLGTQQGHLRPGIGQHPAGDRVALRVVTVQQALRRPPVDLGGELPAQVERVLDPEVEPLPAGRRVDVRGVAGQQHPAGPVALGLPRRVAETGEPVRRVRAEVGARDGPQPRPELLQRRRRRPVLGHAVRRHDHPRDPRAAVDVRRHAEPQLGPPHPLDHLGDLRPVLGELKVPDQRLDRSRLTRESHPERLAHRAAPAVAPDEVARAQPGAVRQFDVHTVRVLVQPGHLVAAPDLGAQLTRPFLQQPLGDRLRRRQPVRVGGVQAVRPGRHDAAEQPAHPELLAHREEPLQQPPLVHDLHAARVQTASARLGRPLLQALQHHHADPVQPQLAREHQTGRPATDHAHICRRTHIHHRSPRPAVSRHPPGETKKTKSHESAVFHARPFQIGHSAPPPPPCGKAPHSL